MWCLMRKWGVWWHLLLAHCFLPQREKYPYYLLMKLNCINYTYNLSQNNSNKIRSKHKIIYCYRLNKHSELRLVSQKSRKVLVWGYSFQQFTVSDLLVFHGILCLIPLTRLAGFRLGCHGCWYWGWGSFGFDLIFASIKILKYCFFFSLFLPVQSESARPYIKNVLWENLSLYSHSHAVHLSSQLL